MILGLALAALLASAAADLPAQAAGLWRTPSDGGSLVRLEPCGGKLCGSIVSSPRLTANPAQQDVLNSDPARRGRRLKGLRILEVTPRADGHRADGWVYNPEDGRTYKGALRIEPDGRLHLTGCVVRPLCKTQVWRRAGAADSGVL